MIMPRKFFSMEDQLSKVEPAPCSRTALVRDRYIDEIKAEMKNTKVKKVPKEQWDKIVQNMKDKERAKMEYDKMEKVDQKTFETLEKRVETLETKYQDLIENLRIFMVNDDE